MKLDLGMGNSRALYEALHCTACKHVTCTYLHKLIFFIANNLIERSKHFFVSSIERIPHVVSHNN